MNIEDNFTVSNLVHTYNEYRPAYNNLFTIEILSEDSPEEYELKNYIQFHATDVLIGEDSLNLIRNDASKKFQLQSQGSYKRNDQMTITWRESDDWRVKKYHEDWLSCFYDKNKDTFISYPINSGVSAQSILCRTFRIILPVAISSHGYNFPRKICDTDGIIKNKTNKEISKSNSIIVTGAIPSSTGKIDLKWSNQPSIISHTMNYFIEEWHWETMENTKK